ncbi:hypothetical protein AVEN_194861-1 [Araneus ventricosus]|uniref:Uncharacterized protein n=1 Tax=Araneus ventricosus TaxID=182803 RepID=A0A4Y2B6C5_ARAVE|nr:hypothetical protein AVEN_194861-1 [Araneus ventricosus]
MWWMREEIIQSENATNTLTDLTPEATSAKIQPEGIDSRGTSYRNNREPVVIILCPGDVTLARSCGHRKSKDLHHGTPAVLDDNPRRSSELYQVHEPVHPKEIQSQ